MSTYCIQINNQTLYYNDASQLSEVTFNTQIFIILENHINTWRGGSILLWLLIS